MISFYGLWVNPPFVKTSSSSVMFLLLRHLHLQCPRKERRKEKERRKGGSFVSNLLSSSTGVRSLHGSSVERKRHCRRCLPFDKRGKARCTNTYKLKVSSVFSRSRNLKLSSSLTVRKTDKVEEKYETVDRG